MNEQRRLRFGKDSGGSTNTGPQFAEMVIWERLLTAEEVTAAANYASEMYTL
ncbi:hypothetical protein QYS46_04970 [Klebsiella michiganensis]|nr:hypothetical protein [Klebsiella michiganensis]